MEDQRIAIGEDGKIQILNSKTVFQDGKLDILIDGDYLIDAKDVIKLLAKDQVYVGRRFVPAKGLQSERIYVDRTLNGELYSALEERDQYRESFLKLHLENVELKHQVNRLMEHISAYGKSSGSKKTKLGWF